MTKTSIDSFKCQQTLNIGDTVYTYYSLTHAEKNGLNGVSELPQSLKVLLEDLLRHEDGITVAASDIRSLAECTTTASQEQIEREVFCHPGRVLMQDFTGVPAVVDLAAMRDGMADLGGDPSKVNPLVQVDLVVDHSIVVNRFGTKDAMQYNISRDYEQNLERYRFLKWGQQAFDNFRVVPPGTGICHQVNLEYLAKVVLTTILPDKSLLIYPDTCVGTDSHTTMINGLSVLGWGVGGIEAEAVMLGQPVSMLIPEVVGFKVKGSLKEGVTATDLVLTVTEMLRSRGVVGKFVEFFGSGVDTMSIADRATIANMSPEYGATCCYFPIDAKTIEYLRLTGRSQEHVDLVEAYAKAQGMWGAVSEERGDIFKGGIIELDLGQVLPSMAGPKRPEGRKSLAEIAPNFRSSLRSEYGASVDSPSVVVKNKNFNLQHGDIVIAAITSCTNTSNPNIMIAAGLLAKNAAAKGLVPKPWVKTSFAPGSQVVAEYLETSGLQRYLDDMGFNIVGFGCTTCIGNSGPLDHEISQAINTNGVIAAAVLSGNRNFEGRISPDTQANYLASPPLVVAYAIAGSVQIDLTKDPIGTSSDGHPVYLRDIWPSASAIDDVVLKHVTPFVFRKKYADVFAGDDKWQAIEVNKGKTFAWQASSTYVQKPPYFSDITKKPSPISDITNARILALFGDKITTDHISPAGSIKPISPAGKYLIEHGVAQEDFNQYGTRRGNHEIMVRGTFANTRIKNHMIKDESGQVVEGGWTIHYPSGRKMAIHDAAEEYLKAGIPLVVFAGVEYGNGSSRDWAAKGPNLLGVRVVIAESFERIHRSNLVGMGIIPLQLESGISWKSFDLHGDEFVRVLGLSTITPRQKISVIITSPHGSEQVVTTTCRIDTSTELEYYKHGGILQYVLRMLAG